MAIYYRCFFLFSSNKCCSINKSVKKKGKFLAHDGGLLLKRNLRLSLNIER